MNSTKNTTNRNNMNNIANNTNKKRRRRKKRRNPLMPFLILLPVLIATAIILSVVFNNDYNDNSNVSSQAASSSDDSTGQTPPTPTTEPEREFWGNNIDLSATQKPLTFAGKHPKWPSEPGFESVVYNLDKFKAAAGKDKPLTGAVVFLDPGHGGEDLGAVFPRAPIKPEIIESRINLSVAFKLKGILEQAGAKVVLTREDDYFYRLYYRSAVVGKFILNDFLNRLDPASGNRPHITKYISEMDKTIAANNNDDPAGIFYPLGVNQTVKNILDIEGAYNNCIYLALHCNASAEPETINGTRVFYVTNDSVYRKQAGETKDIICPEYQNYNDEARLRLSNLIYDRITGNLPQMEFSQDSGAVEVTDYAVIREMNLVGALIEMGFVNHSADRAVLLDEANLAIYADSIYDAIFDYFCR
ncbi:MAG: N-acetylmuramoyl-L-alanine amidase family protein [Saccharofermentanales bacterium]